MIIFQMSRSFGSPVYALPSIQAHSIKQTLPARGEHGGGFIYDQITLLWLIVLVIAGFLGF